MTKRGRFQPGPAYRAAVLGIQHNPEQVAAFRATGNIAVLAGPGSGKTRILTLTLARILAEDISPPFKVACISYNNECVRELRRRLVQLGAYDRDSIFVGTMHSFCFSQILLPFAHLCRIGLTAPLRPATDSTRKTILATALEAAFGATPPPKPEVLLKSYRRDKAIGRTLTQYSDRGVAFARAYDRALIAQNQVDVDGMVFWALGLFRRHGWLRKAVTARFPVLAIDEYQDFGPELHAFAVEVLNTRRTRMIVVGDPDQSIYGFIGADPSLLGNMAARPEFSSVRLRFNYRCGSTIIGAAEAALGQQRNYAAIDDRKGTLDLYGPRGGIADEARYILDDLIPAAIARQPGRTLGDCAILYLDKNDGDVFGALAAERGLKCQRVDANAAYRKTRCSRFLEDCASWCAGGWRNARPRLSALGQEWRGWTSIDRSRVGSDRLHKQFVAFMVRHRTPNLPLRTWLLGAKDAFLDAGTVGAEHEDDRGQITTLVELTDPGRSLTGMTIREFGGQAGSPDHLNLLTLHSSKGLEFDVVAIPGVDNGRLPKWDADTDEKRQEYRRLFYVGITRAKNEVHISYSGFTIDSRGRTQDNGRSIFLDEVERRATQAD